MEETPATRLKLFIDTRGLSTSQFADMCGIPRPSLSQILSGRNKKISDILIGQIHRAFPDLSVVWLLFGEGPVMVSSSNLQVSNSLKSPDGGVLRPSDRRADSPDGSMSDTAQFTGDDTPPMVADAFFMPEDIDEMVAYNKKMRMGAPYGRENENVNGLRNANNDANSTTNQVFESDLKIMDLRRQIEQMRQNPRKVVQITIYYDDSTFETFIPK